MSVATFYSRYTQFNGNQLVVICISVGTAFLTFAGILVYHLYQCATNSRAWKCISNRFINQQRQFPLNDRELVHIAAEGSDEEEEEPAQAEIQPLILYFDEYREPVLGYEDQDCHYKSTYQTSFILLQDYAPDSMFSSLLCC